MEDAGFIVYLSLIGTVIVLSVWVLVRVYQYTFGANGDYIYVPWLVWIALVLGFWIPFVNVLVIAYILFVCKSAGRLMDAREQLLHEFTPTDVIEATENLILENKLYDDEWVTGVWNKTSSEEWVKRFSSNPTVFRKTLDQKVQIHASRVQLYAEWVDVVKHYLYLEGRS